MFHWVAVFLSVGWPTPHVTGPRIHVLQLLYDLPLFAAVVRPAPAQPGPSAALTMPPWRPRALCS